MIIFCLNKQKIVCVGQNSSGELCFKFDPNNLTTLIMAFGIRIRNATSHRERPPTFRMQSTDKRITTNYNSILIVNPARLALSAWLGSTRNYTVSMFAAQCYPFSSEHNIKCNSIQLVFNWCVHLVHARMCACIADMQSACFNYIAQVRLQAHSHLWRNVAVVQCISCFNFESERDTVQTTIIPTQNHAS